MIEETIEKHRDIIKQRVKEAQGRLRLHLGCGIRHLPGWVNIDVSAECGPDMTFDLRDEIPFNKKTVTNIFSRDFLEHIPKDKLIFLMNECNRVLKAGGVCCHEVPEAPHPNAFQDPTHVNFFTLGTAYYWAKSHKSARWEKYGRNYGIVPFRAVKAVKIPEKHTGKASGWIRMNFYR